MVSPALLISLLTSLEGGQPMRIRSLIPILAVTALAVIGGTANAAPDPSKTPIPYDGTPYTIPAGVACSFPVEIQDSGKHKELVLPGNRMLFTFPGYDATLTNVDA